MNFVRCCHDLAFTVKLRASDDSVGVAMNANQSLSVCESVLARLDAALQMADAEAKCASAAEQEIRGLVSRLLRGRERHDSEIDVSTAHEPHLRCFTQSDDAANDNPAHPDARHPVAFWRTIANGSGHCRASL
jgi:hypothetical protein